MGIVSIYAVFASADEAERIGRIVIEERLAACINIFGPCRSIYRWQGAIESANEVPAILKTGGDKAGALIERIAALHSYKVPCVAAWSIGQVLQAYSGWIEEAVANEG